MTTPPEVPTRWRHAALLDPPPRFRSFARLFGVRVRPDDPDVLRLRDGLMQTDTVADDFVAWAAQAPSGIGRRLFERAVDHGIDAVPEAPPELVRWFAPIESPPSWLNPDALRLAAHTTFRVGAAGGAVLTGVALMGGYRSQAAVKPLAMTGALERMAKRRIAETSRFVLDVTGSETMPRFSDGWKSTARVRLMHTMVRRSLRQRSDWDTAAWGMPINQTDTAATHLEFSAIYITGLRALGFRFTEDEREAIMHLWRYVSILMGADDALLAHDYRSGLRQMYIHGVTNPPADDDSRALAQALHRLPMQLASTPWERAVAKLQTRAQTALSRLVLGDEAIDDLGLPRAPLHPLLLGLSATRWGAETLRRAIPGATALAAKRGRDMQRRVVADLVGREKVRYVPYGDRGAKPSEPPGLRVVS
ncbi:MAG: DUF2236 domain-containing protein [Myxococcales bacterium]|nr:DUF2236 domain-containing protein [Myxococcales bacterium]